MSSTRYSPQHISEALRTNTCSKTTVRVPNTGIPPTNTFVENGGKFIPGYPGTRVPEMSVYPGTEMFACALMSMPFTILPKKHLRILNTHTKNNTPPLVCTHCMYLLQSAKERGESLVVLWSMCLPADRAVSGLPSRIIIYVQGNKIAKCSSTRYVFEHQGGRSSTDVFSFTALSLV